MDPSTFPVSRKFAAISDKVQIKDIYQLSKRIIKIRWNRNSCSAENSQSDDKFKIKFQILSIISQDFDNSIKTELD